MTDQTIHVSPEEAISIIRECAAKVYDVLGPDYQEATYEKAMEIALRNRKLVFETQRMVPLFFEGVAVRDVRDEIDLVVWAQNEGVPAAVIVDFKADSKIDSAHRSQVARYQQSLGTELDGTGKKVHPVGLVINFPKGTSRAISVGLERQDRVQFLSVAAADGAARAFYTQAFWDAQGELTSEGAYALAKLIEDRDKALAKERDKLVLSELLIGLGLCPAEQNEECQDLRLYVREEEAEIEDLRSRLSNLRAAVPDTKQSVQTPLYTQAFWDDQGQLKPEGLDDLEKVIREREKDFAKKRLELVVLEVLAQFNLSPIQDQAGYERLRCQVLEEERRITFLKERLDELRAVVEKSQPTP